MGLVFLTPVAAAVGAAALLPVVLALVRERRNGTLRRALGLHPPSLPVRFSTALAAALLVACLAAAAAQPALRRSSRRPVRTDAQIVFVLDVTRSMLARSSPHAPTRFARAVSLAERLSGAFPDVPAGVASLSDWLLPHVFPTLDRTVFVRSLERTIGPGRPAPYADQPNATDFSALFALGPGRYFDAKTTRRLAVVLSDGESRPFTQQPLVAALRQRRVRLLVVRVWRRGEGVYLGARRDPGYVSDPLAMVPLEQLATSTAGGRVFFEDEPGAISTRMRQLLGSGPRATIANRRQTVPLAPYVVLAGVLPLGFLLVRR
jgi:hypothetical protein